MAREIEQSIKIDSEIDEVFRSLTTPTDIKAWWGAVQVIIAPEVGGILAISWGDNLDQPDYISIAEIEAFDPPNYLRLVHRSYKAQNQSLPFDANFVVEYWISEQGNMTELKVKQSGFADAAIADDYYHGCVQGWQTTLVNLKEFLEKKRLE